MIGKTLYFIRSLRPVWAVITIVVLSGALIYSVIMLVLVLMHEPGAH
jgi:hypothetical protein